MVVSLVGWVEHQRNTTLIKHELLVSDDCSGCIGELNKKHIQIHSQTTPLSARGRALQNHLWYIARILNVIDARFRRSAEELLGGTLVLPLL
ncbi:hypothetical protein CY34DRAFT_813395 [Suillus luteus UH-Slu-Lm8-n1]|uniref:Uncharacterized protein n=1 Tax=Suillus luteus UH-Slu-Lm8-n1 TaxID=930992 RepID=A0A0D0A699_9AGAM|nr:hypothetical protein CY34DRAFT_813395 [Suillus luteus UH-Slu-Lm8-n1]